MRYINIEHINSFKHFKYNINITYIKKVDLKTFYDSLISLAERITHQ